MNIKCSKIFGLLATIGILTLSNTALATQFRVSSYVYGESYASTHTTVTDVLGNSLLDTYGNQYFDSQSQYSTTTSPVSFNSDFRQYGDLPGTTSAHWSGYAQTTYGGNHLALSMTGAASSYTGNFSGVDPSSGTTISVTSSPTRYASGYSTWEELFLITSAYGRTGQSASLTFHVHLSGEVTGNSSYLGYQLNNFDGSNVVSEYKSGNVGSFNQDLIGTFSFKYGDPLYLQSQLWGGLSDIGLVDASHSAVITGIDLPTGSAIRFLSGAASSSYGAIAGGVYGEYGAGGTLPPVPEPESYAMLLAGLGLMAGIARRRNRRA